MPVAVRAQSNDLLSALDYPDGQTVPFYGSLTYTAKLDGATESGEPGKEGYTKTSWKNAVTKVTIAYDRQGSTFKKETSGAIVEDSIRECNGKLFHDIQTKTFSGGATRKKGRDEEFAKATMQTSRQQGLAVVNLASELSYSTDDEQPNSTRIHTGISGWHSDGVSEGCVHYDESSDETADVGILTGGRVPNYGAVSSSRFGVASKAAETQGKEAGQPLGGAYSGHIEVAWNGVSANGEATIPVLFHTTPSGASWNTEAVFRAQEEDISDGTFLPGTLTIGWNIGTEPVQSEMTIEPTDIQDYDDWLPLPAEPSASDKSIYGTGRAIIFKAALTPKDKDKPAPRSKIDFYLQDVSRHKGISTNYPKNAAEKDDLKFASSQPSGVIVDPSDPKHAYTSGPVASADVSIEAADTGAYGKLTARAESLGLQAVYKRTGANSIQIPRDDNNNHVADKWERDEEVIGKNYAANWDEDAYPEGQRRNGDGYTLYEEYRGFVTLKQPGDLQKSFVRTSPNKKDIFVYDRDRLIKQYYESYNPAQLQLHYIDNTLMEFNQQALDPTNRWVNINSSPDEWYARQYAIYAYTENNPTESGGSNNIERLKDMPAGYDAFAQPLKTFYEMAISPTGVRSQFPVPPFSAQEQQDAFKTDMTVTVIHEFGHYIGISHHRLGGAESDASVVGGVLACPMRYYNQTDIDEFNKTRVLQARTSYCRVGQTGAKIKTVQHGFAEKVENGVKKQVPIYQYFIDPTGSVPSDDCYHKIDVKSDP